MTLNRIELAGNLVDNPTITQAGHRYFVRGRLAQNWSYETRGHTETHRHVISLVFFGNAESIAKNYQKGDNIHVIGTLIRRAPSSAPAKDGSLDTATVYEVHVTETYPIGKVAGAPPEQEPPHQNTIRAAGATTQPPFFLKESIYDWPT